MKKSFHLMDILYVYFSEHSIFDLKSNIGAKILLKHIFQGRNFYDHELQSAAEKCKPFLLTQVPKLEDVNTEFLGTYNKNEWFREQVKKCGDIHYIEQMDSLFCKY
jgi:hypothetical protein